MGWAWTAALAGGHGAEVAGASRVIRREIDELYLVEVSPLSLTRLSALGGGGHILGVVSPQSRKDEVCERC